MFGMIWYTILCVALNEVASGGGSNLMTAEDRANMTPSIHAERVRGSKWVFVSEHAFILTIWSFKSCMLVIYSRITYVTFSISLLGSLLTQYLTGTVSLKNDSLTTVPYTLPSVLLAPNLVYS
jgi:hypothetical protein